MAYNIDFALAALIFLEVQHIFLLVQYNNNIPTIRRFRQLLFFMILADIADIVTALTIVHAPAVPLWLNYVLNVVYFELTAICISLFPKYIHSILEKYNIRTGRLDRINNILLIVYASICASTPVTHLIFYFDENKLYRHGYLYYSVYILPMYFFIYSFVRLISNKKCFNTRQHYSIIFFIILSMLGPTVQILLPDDNKILFDYFALSIAAFVIISGLETPDFIALEKALAELNEHKNALEKAKKKEEEINKAIHEMTKTASWSIRMDSNHNITESYWSDEFFWMLGYDRAELGEREHLLWSDSLHPEDAQDAIDSFMRGFEGSDNYDIFYRLRDKYGEYKWYRGTGELKFDEKTNETVYMGIIQDTNDSVIQDTLMRERLAVLEELEKSQAALKEALEKAESADKAKSEFLANMSHEIRTPINAVLGMNELIARESTEPNIQAYSNNVADAGNALLSLVNDVLDFSKIEAGKMDLVPSEYELSILLREVKNILSTKCNDKGIEFIIKNNPNIPNNLFGDEVRIRQIMVNLLNNAVKYTEKGSVTLDVDFTPLEDGTINLIISTIDTGIGIRKEDLPALFESFKRIDLKQNRKREGSGLGLNITKSFVELMGGKIEVSSIYGQGSTFTIQIPQTVKGDSVIGEFNSTSPASHKSKYVASFSAPEAKVLVVDDVPINLKVIKGLLKQTQIQVTTSESGKNCLELLASQAFDIVLLDHMMPEMDGIEVMETLNKNRPAINLNTPVIMLTANAIIGAKEEYLNIGFADYLSKPVHPEELEAMLLKHLPSDKIVNH